MLTPAKMTDYLGPDLDRLMARLPQGSISDALAGPTGWHFFKIIRNQPGTPPAFEDIRRQIVDALRRDNDDESLRDYLGWLRGRADIVLAARRAAISIMLVRCLAFCLLLVGFAARVRRIIKA